jgi:hypothetical protein
LHNTFNNNGFCFEENLSLGGTSPIHTALSICRLELQRNGKKINKLRLIRIKRVKNNRKTISYAMLHAKEPSLLKAMSAKHKSKFAILSPAMVTAAR